MTYVSIIFGEKFIRIFLFSFKTIISKDKHIFYFVVSTDILTMHANNVTIVYILKCYISLLIFEIC